MAEKKIQEHKRVAVQEMTEFLQSAKAYIFADYRGLTVEQISELRNQLREENAAFKVVKNRVAKLAFHELDAPESINECLIGPTGIAMINKDAGLIAKILFKFTRDAPLDVKGGFIDGNVFDAKQVEDFSKLPTRDELLASLMGTMNAPLQNLMFAMRGVTQKLVRTLQAVVDQKSEASA